MFDGFFSASRIIVNWNNDVGFRVHELPELECRYWQSKSPAIEQGGAYLDVISETKRQRLLKTIFLDFRLTFFIIAAQKKGNLSNREYQKGEETTKKKPVCPLIPLFVFLTVSLFSISTTFAQIYVVNTAGNSIPSYSSNATGNVSPLTNIQAPANGLHYVW